METPKEKRQKLTRADENDDERVLPMKEEDRKWEKKEKPDSA